jgi:hypothetical protein
MRRVVLFAALAALVALGTIATQVTLAQGTRQLLVGYHSAPGASDIATVESLGGRVTHQFKYIPVLAVALPESQVTTLAATSGVAYVEEDVPIRS